jgi:hypothetical protein
MNNFDDDPNSLIQWAGACTSLEDFYKSPHVFGEKALDISGNISFDESKQTKYLLEYTPVLKGTLIGHIYHNSKKAQTFFANGNDVFHIRPSIKEDAPKLQCIKLCNNTGILTLEWDRKIIEKECQLFVAYDYDYEVPIINDDY